MTENEIASQIVDAAYELHKRTGPGLLESVYRDCLKHLLEKRGLEVEKEKIVPLFFDGLKFDTCYRIDLLVNDKVIIEIKSVAELNDVHLAQVITYLKLVDKKLGLLINFNVPLIKKGIRRIVNGLPA